MKKSAFALLLLLGASSFLYAQSRVSGVWIRADGYLNWGNLRGETGYGLRDNGGTIEIKNDGDIGWTNLGAAGNPGGSAGQIQYNNGANFGGIPITWNTTRLLSTVTGRFLWLQPGSNPTTQNGYFQFNVSRSANGMPDPRNDDGFNMGWNLDGACTGCGGAQLAFEAHCSDATGCLDGIGQSETYFAMDDGSGTAVRPFGMFQRADSMLVPNMQIIFNFDDMRFNSAREETEMAAWGWADGATRGTLNLDTTKVIASPAANSDFLVIGGIPYLSYSTDSKTGIVIGSGGSSVSLAPGGDGSAVVGVFSNNFQLNTGKIYDTSAAERIALQAGSAAAYPSMSIGGGEIGIKPAGSNTNIGTRISSKGNSDLTIDSTDAGTGNIVIQADGSAGSEIRLRTRVLSINNETDNGYRQGVTVTGTSCTITRITHGIITAATCS